MKRILHIIPLIALCALSCSNDLKEVNKVIEKSEAYFEIGENVTMIFSEDAIVKVNLKAPVVKRSVGREEFTEFPEGIEVDFYNDSLETDTKLKSNYAKRLDNQDIFEMKGNVIVQNSFGETLKTEELIYNRRSKKLHTEKAVNIRTENQIIFGKGLTANEDFSRWEIKDITNSYTIFEQSTPNN